MPSIASITRPATDRSGRRTRRIGRGSTATVGGERIARQSIIIAECYGPTPCDMFNTCCGAAETQSVARIVAYLTRTGGAGRRGYRADLIAAVGRTGPAGRSTGSCNVGSARTDGCRRAGLRRNRRCAPRNAPVTILKRLRRCGAAPSRLHRLAQVLRHAARNVRGGFSSMTIACAAAGCGVHGFRLWRGCDLRLGRRRGRHAQRDGWSIACRAVGCRHRRACAGAGAADAAQQRRCTGRWAAWRPARRDRRRRRRRAGVPAPPRAPASRAPPPTATSRGRSLLFMLRRFDAGGDHGDADLAGQRLRRSPSRR